jgi:hypothetical protein
VFFVPLWFNKSDFHLCKEITVANRFKIHFFHRQLLLRAIGLLAIAYISTCLFLFFRQHYLIFRPTHQILTLPSSADFNLPYQQVKLQIADSNENLNAWWVPAPSSQDNSYLRAIEKFMNTVESTQNTF